MDVRDAMATKRYDVALARLVEWEAGMDKCATVPPAELLSYELARTLLQRAIVFDKEAN